VATAVHDELAGNGNRGTPQIKSGGAGSGGLRLRDDPLEAGGRSFPDFGLTFGNPEFVRYAESYGAKGTRIESTDAILPTLERAFAGGGVHLVVVPIDYSENIRVLVDELREKLKRVDGSQN